VPNYFAPAFQVEVDGTKLQADVSMNIEEVQVVSKPDTLDTFTFTITNALPKMRWTHTSDADLFNQAKSVKIAMGYVDDLQEMMEGEITQITPTFPDSGVPTLAIEGHALLHRLHGTNRTRTFQQVSDKQIVEQIARDAGLQAEAEDPNMQYEYVIQPNQTDLEFLRERARRIHFEILVRNKTLIFRKSQEAQDKTYTLVWAQMQKSVASGGNTLPMGTCSLQFNALKPPTDVEVRCYDPKSKQAFVSHANSSDQTSKMAGTQTGGDVTGSFPRPSNHVHVSTPFPSQEECDRHAKAIYNNEALGLVTGTVTTIGAPDLRSGQVIEMLGIGRRFEGSYCIDEATHSIGSSGYQTSLTVKRNAVS
jgi:phage protein D